VRRRRRARSTTRVERDSLGPVQVPRRALWGAFTERARHTFHLSGRPPHPALVRGYALVKQAAARVNARLGLPSGLAAMDVPVEWYDRIIEGALADHCHKTNPRLASAEDYREMLAASM